MPGATHDLSGNEEGERKIMSATYYNLPENTHSCRKCVYLRRIAYPNDEQMDIRFECGATMGHMEVNGFADDPAPWLGCRLYMKDNCIDKIHVDYKFNPPAIGILFMDGTQKIISLEDSGRV